MLLHLLVDVPLLLPNREWAVEDPGGGHQRGHAGGIFASFVYQETRKGERYFARDFGGNVGIQQDGLSKGV